MIDRFILITYLIRGIYQLIAVLADLHVQNVTEKGIEAERGRENENARDKLHHQLLLAIHKVMYFFYTCN